MRSAIRLPKSPETRLVFAALALILAVRAAAVLVSPLNLYADEAQYWRWAQGLAWGYYSKPPMIACLPMRQN